MRLKGKLLDVRNDYEFLGNIDRVGFFLSLGLALPSFFSFCCISKGFLVFFLGFLPGSTVCLTQKPAASQLPQVEPGPFRPSGATTCGGRTALGISPSWDGEGDLLGCFSGGFFKP